MTIDYLVIVRYDFMRIRRKVRTHTYLIRYVFYYALLYFFVWEFKQRCEPPQNVFIVVSSYAYLVSFSISWQSGSVLFYNCHVINTSGITDSYMSIYSYIEEHMVTLFRENLRRVLDAFPVFLVIGSTTPSRECRASERGKGYTLYFFSIQFSKCDTFSCRHSGFSIELSLPLIYKGLVGHLLRLKASLISCSLTQVLRAIKSSFSQRISLFFMSSRVLFMVFLLNEQQQVNQSKGVSLLIVRFQIQGQEYAIKVFR